MDYDTMLTHRGHDLTIVGSGEENQEFSPAMAVLRCKTCDQIVHVEALVSRLDFRECEYPGCNVQLPREDMVQFPGGEYFCPPHARDAERMP